MVSSDVVLLAFFVWFMAPVRTLRRDSLALWVSCLATVARFSLCSRVILMGEKDPLGMSLNLPRHSGAVHENAQRCKFENNGENV